MLLLEEAREERGVRARTPGGNIGGSAEGVVMAEGAVSGTSELWENKQMKMVHCIAATNKLPAMRTRQLCLNP